MATKAMQADPGFLNSWERCWRLRAEIAQLAEELDEEMGHAEEYFASLDADEIGEVKADVSEYRQALGMARKFIVQAMARMQGQPVSDISDRIANMKLPHG